MGENWFVAAVALAVGLEVVLVEAWKEEGAVVVAEAVVENLSGARKECVQMKRDYCYVVVDVVP